ncbi:hypothetical protein CPLU01_12296 [Colletotrichum plurivorum]|uniref:F-box domain-containing protein n=1 Tax=Colletotrichum plurivorum TaxID=2175906 RepID=A0A8H6K073_9PEZI|nr:hypothetical protein CPLU01_12296 [Colletotrichum plurivorum]
MQSSREAWLTTRAAQTVRHPGPLDLPTEIWDMILDHLEPHDCFLLSKAHRLLQWLAGKDFAEWQRLLQEATHSEKMTFLMGLARVRLDHWPDQPAWCRDGSDWYGIFKIDRYASPMIVEGRFLLHSRTTIKYPEPREDRTELLSCPHYRVNIWWRRDGKPIISSLDLSSRVVHCILRAYRHRGKETTGAC